VGLLALVLAAGGLAASLAEDDFDHVKHAKLFPTCEACHSGIAGGDFATSWPTAEGCAACHDGTIEEKVEWSPPIGPGGNNLRFTHVEHGLEVARQAATDSVLECASCHIRQGEAWMTVRRASARRCLACHGIAAAHLEAPDSACATCHLPLAQAASLPGERISAFAAPPSHQAQDFALGGHGRLATAGTDPVAASCATCHAKEYCTTCHVDAPETRAIQALASDPRSLLIPASLASPASHARPDFVENHRKDVGKDAAACQTCHTQESCLQCHVGQPKAARALYAAGPGRGLGAATTRRRPASHGVDFSEAHAEPAGRRPQTCAACHTLTTCLDCHRPNPADGQTRLSGAVGSGARGYHPPAFLTRHPASAYAQETECADCHNTAVFCLTCHAQAGLGANGPLTAGFHDAKRFFLTGHGQAARQSLESCTSCHVERDCLTCHAAVGGRGFNPHGPGFDADRLRKKNPNMCTACHGATIPP
jgi:hypothetical protein